MGFPVLLKLTSNELGAEGGVIILAVTLTRAPLLVPLTAMQGNLIAHFVDARSDRVRALLAPAGIIGGIGAVGVLAAGVVGPWLLRVAFGPQYHASGALLAWLTAAAVAIAMLTLTGAGAVAAALHRAYSLGWVGRDGGVGTAAAATAAAADAHRGRLVVRSVGRNRRSSGGALARRAPSQLIACTFWA